MVKNTAGAEELGIDLTSKDERQLFGWFLACLLFGKPIQQSIAQNAYAGLTAAGIDSIETLAAYDWAELVKLLDQAHYVRFDYSAARKLIEIAASVRNKYGTITGLLDEASDRADLERRLIELKGVGPKTAEIFMRSIIASGLK